MAGEGQPGGGIARRWARGALFVGMGALASCALGAEAWADKRVALAIGNATYSKPLRTPAADARAIRALLISAGFETQVVIDASGEELRRALTAFSERTRDADVVALFYAGHGAEISGFNIVLPVDAVAEGEVALEKLVTLDQLIEATGTAKRLKLIMLDTSRHDPCRTRAQERRTMLCSAAALAALSAPWRPTVENSAPLPPQPTRGLALITPRTDDPRRNLLVAFAAEAGGQAQDGEPSASNSPFTTALLHNLTRPGEDIRFALGRAGDEVAAETGGSQRPYILTSLGGGVVSLTSPGPRAEDAAPVLPPR